MKNRLIIAVAIILLLFLSIILLRFRRQGVNIILISIDTLRADHLGCYGYQRSTSPNIDSLAKEGVMFESSFSLVPLTTPSHMSIMTSLHPDVHKVMQWGKDRPNGDYLDPKIPTIAAILKKRNYTNVAFTGWGNVHPSQGFDRGFDIYKSGTIKGVLSWLNKNYHKKFFIFFHTHALHDPYLPDSRYNRIFAPSYQGKVIDSWDKMRVNKSDWDDSHNLFWASVNKGNPQDIDFIKAQYDANIFKIDSEMIGPLLNKLRALGIYKNTMIIFTADHGEAFGEHSNFLHNSLYTEVLRVPLIIVCPKIIPKNITVKQLVRLIDIMPTILDILGIKINKTMQGKCLLPAILKNEFMDLRCYSILFNSKAIRTSYFTFIQVVDSDGRIILRSLYNRIKDPEEREDIALTRPELANSLEKQLEEETGICRKLSLDYQQFEGTPLDSEASQTLRSLGYL